MCRKSIAGGCQPVVVLLVGNIGLFGPADLLQTIGAGAVVTRNVADYALVVGVPGRQIGWMSRHGYKLKFDDDGNAVCPESGIRYVKRGNMVFEYE